MFPSDDLAEHWARERGLELTGLRAWGVPLVRRGGLLRTAGMGEFPGTFLSLDEPGIPSSSARGGAAAVVLHHVVGEQGTLERVCAVAPSARIYLRYECAVADFGSDPEAYLESQLSAKRRKRLRRHIRELEERGEIALDWVGPGAVDELFERFFRMLCLRAASSRLYDAALLRRDALHGLWRRFAGSELLVSVMRVGGVPVSFRTGFAVGPRFVGHMPAIDRTFSAVSMGDVHLALLLPLLAERGLTSYCIGQGAPGKRDIWATGAYSLSTIVIPVSHSARARARAGLEGARQRARRAITGNGLERPLRRVLHRGLDRPGSAYRRALQHGLSGS